MTARVSEVEIPFEVPQLYFPKGPIRRIASHVEVTDAVAGHVVVARLACGHETTLVGPFPFEPDKLIVKCAYCHFDRFADGGRKA